MVLSFSKVYLIVTIWRGAMVRMILIIVIVLFCGDSSSFASLYVFDDVSLNESFAVLEPCISSEDVSIWLPVNQVNGRGRIRLKIKGDVAYDVEGHSYNMSESVHPHWTRVGDAPFFSWDGLFIGSVFGFGLCLLVDRILNEEE
jgi:hypothetical protein